MIPRQLLVIASLAFLSGCASIRGFTANNPKRPATAKEQEVDQVVARWNQNANNVRSIRCDVVDISGKADGKPIPLTAKLGYSEPNNFRLAASSIGGKNELDLGSNHEVIWFWVARAPQPGVYFCKREDFKDVNLSIPFHPDWIVDLLGVSAIDLAKFRPGFPDDEVFTLVANEKTPTGHDVIKRVAFRRDTGRLEGIELFDPNRKDGKGYPTKMMTAKIIKYHDDESTGLYVPKKIEMDWPESETNLTITMPERKIQLNQNIPPALFAFGPQTFPELEYVDLGQKSRAMQANAQRQSNGGGPSDSGYDPRLQPAGGTRLRGVIETN